MSQPRTFSQSDYAAVIGHFKRMLRFHPEITEVTIAFRSVTKVVPDKNQIRVVQASLKDEYPLVMKALADRIALQFNTEPTQAQIISALAAMGYPGNTRKARELKFLMRVGNSERWTEVMKSRKKSKISLVGGDEAMVSALKRLYGGNLQQLTSMLLRLFVKSIQTGKMDYVSAPHVASSLTDQDMIQLAKAINFKLPKSTRKVRP